MGRKTLPWSWINPHCPERVQGLSRKYPATAYEKTFVKEGTRHKKLCTQDNDASVPIKAGSLGPHTILPGTISCPIIFYWISSTVWNLFPFKGYFSFGKNQKLQGTKSGLYAGWVWFNVLPKHSAPRCGAWVGTLSWWSCQPPVAYSCGPLHQ